MAGVMRRLGSLSALGPAEGLWRMAAIGFLIAFVTMGIVQQLDARLLNGESVWAKPLKFAISTAVHFGSIALAVRWLRPAWSSSGWMTVLAVASIAAGVFEVAYIALQGALGVPSHFNISTPLYAMLWSTMAAAAVVVLAPMAVTGLLAALDGQGRWPVSIRVSVATGMLGGALLTLVTAFRMGANMSHFIGTPPPWDGFVPVTGWSWRGADLRPAHFLATHMAQVIPILAVVASLLMPPRALIVLVVAFAVGWTGLTILVFSNALAGRSLAALLQL